MVLEALQGGLGQRGAKCLVSSNLPPKDTMEHSSLDRPSKLVKPSVRRRRRLLACSLCAERSVCGRCSEQGSRVVPSVCGALCTHGWRAACLGGGALTPSGRVLVLPVPPRAGVVVPTPAPLQALGARPWRSIPSVGVGRGEGANVAAAGTCMNTGRAGGGGGVGVLAVFSCLGGSPCPPCGLHTPTLERGQIRGRGRRQNPRKGEPRPTRGGSSVT